MRRISVLVLVMVLCVGLAAPASAAIKITTIGFNPPGADSSSNSHLNREYIVIENTGEKGRNISGWRIHDAGGDHAYRFGDLRLGPGDTVTLHTGNGDDGAVVCSGGCPVMYDFYWDLEEYVWGNGRDRATLTGRRAIIDRCSYTASDVSPHPC